MPNAWALCTRHCFLITLPSTSGHGKRKIYAQENIHICCNIWRSYSDHIFLVNETCLVIHVPIQIIVCKAGNLLVVLSLLEIITTNGINLRNGVACKWNFNLYPIYHLKTTHKSALLISRAWFWDYSVTCLTTIKMPGYLSLRINRATNVYVKKI